MGINSKFHRFREAGQSVNTVNAELYGQPVKSLFTSTKVFTLHHHIDITDEDENIVYTADTKFPSLHDRTVIKDYEGHTISDIYRKLLTLHERHFVTMSDGREFQISNELFHLIKDITNIEGLGWQIRGNIVGMNFVLSDENGEVIALISQKFISMHDKYCIDIYKPEYEKIAVTILITLQHMIKDRETASSGSFSSSSSSGQ